MNEVILETMKDNDDKLWHLQKQVDDLSWMVFRLEEQTDKALVLLGEQIKDTRDKLERHLRALGQDPGPPIPKPNPKHTPGRVELREMLLSAVKDLYGKLYLSDEEKTAMSTFECFLSIEDIGWDSRTDVVANYWLPGNIKKLRNHHLEEALRILGVME